MLFNFLPALFESSENFCEPTAPLPGQGAHACISVLSRLSRQYLSRYHRFSRLCLGCGSTVTYTSIDDFTPHVVHAGGKHAETLVVYDFPDYYRYTTPLHVASKLWKALPRLTQCTLDISSLSAIDRRRVLQLAGQLDHVLIQFIYVIKNCLPLIQQQAYAWAVARQRLYV